MSAGLTIRGRCLVAAGVAAGVCALVLDERDLLRVAAFVVILPFLALLLVGHARFGVSASRDVLPARVPVGSPAEVRLRLTSRGRIPVGGLVLEDGTPYALGARPRFELDSVPKHGATQLDYPVTPRLRGIHHIGPLHTRLGDPFGLALFERELADRTRLVAVPKTVSLSGFPAGSGLGTDEDGNTRLRAGHGDDDAMLRQYQHGDDIRRVHWKTTARRDELMVRVEERPWHGGVSVLLDRRSAAHRGSGAGSSVEWAISAVASICLHLHRHGQQARLTTEDGLVLASDTTTGPDGPDNHDGPDNTVLDALAALRTSPQRDLMCQHDPGDGRELIAVLGETTTAGVAELTRLRPPQARSLAILLDVHAWNGAATGGFDVRESAGQLQASGWAVAIADGPQHAFEQVWRQLCQADARRREVSP